MKTSSVTEWLLQDAQPAAKYYTLTDLLDRKPSDPEVREAYSMIPRRGWAASILKKQKPGGFWESRDNLYRPKYTATNWQLLVLSDLGLTIETPAVKKACELYLTEVSGPNGALGGTDSELCLTGNFTRALIRFGYLEDPRVWEALDWLVKAQKEDGGWHCWGKKGTLDCWEALAAFNALPRSRWTRSIKRSVERGAEFFLERELYREGARRYEAWFRLHYPVHYYYDLLVGLDVLTSLGYTGDKRLRTALQLLHEKKRPDGTWAADTAHPDLSSGANYKLRGGEKPLILEQPGKPSKWMTLRAMRVLRRVEP